MNTYRTHPTVSRIANFVVNYPKLNVIVSLLIMFALFTALPNLSKDTRADAFLADDNPALMYRDKVKAQFGLSDPIVVAVVNESDNGVFNPKSLQLVDWLSQKLSAMNNINNDRVTSLATENNITGTTDGMQVKPFFEEYPETQPLADAIWRKVSDFPLYLGNLVAENKKATLIIAELNDESLVEETYQQILALIDSAPAGPNDKLYVAGEGAIAGYLGTYIDQDAQRLNPLAGLIITLIILFAFRRLSPGLLSNVIIAASVLITLAFMAISNVAFFVITNALPVILIGISVADSIHIYSHYFERQATQPNRDKNKIIIETFEEMWRPITLTTLTTVAGFIGLYFAAYMPPFKYFGLFTALGVTIAWIYSLIFLPAALAIIKPTASKKFIKLAQTNQIDRFASLMVALGSISLNNAKLVTTTFFAIILCGLFAATHLQVDEDRIETFHPSEPLYKADKAINKHLNGTYNLDIVVEANEVEGLFQVQHLRKIAKLQEYALTLQNVKGAISIVDYLKQMNRSLNGGDLTEYRLPQQQNLIAQYFLIYAASSSPTDFEEEIDYDYRVANIRLSLNKGSYQETKHVVKQLENYIKNEFDSKSLSATVSGRVTVNYHWIKDLGESHFVGLAISLFLVWAVSALLFGSISAGIFAILPVASSILLVYAAMVILRVDLGIGTSMFASVAIGLGVDFSIHTIDRLKSLYQDNHGDWDTALSQLYPTTGRALFFNYLAISLGFGVLITSKVVPLTNFGTIVIVAVSTSFLASLSLLPAIIKLTKPKFIQDSLQKIENVPHHSVTTKKWLRIPSVILVVGLFLSFIFNNQVLATELPDATQIVNQVNSVDEGTQVTRHLKMTLIDKHGKKRIRDTKAYRKYFGEEKRTILFYKKPTNVKGTSFLTFDYPQVEKDDDQWLYLPALRKVRRISASDRGDYFLGTDFTYEDIKLEGKLSIDDYNYQTLAVEYLETPEGNQYHTVKILSTPNSELIAKELGYGRVESWIDSKTWLVIKAEFWDPKGHHLKTIINSDIREIDGIITRHKLDIRNHKTGHQTIFEFSQVDYQSAVSDDLFSKRAMKRGK